MFRAALYHKFSRSVVPCILALTFLNAPGGRAQTANETAALAEMQQLAQFMDLVALDTTVYVSLENLNDLSSVNTINPWDSIQDQGGPYVIIPSQGNFLPRRNLTTGFNTWKGPYTTYQSNRIQTGTTPYDQGSLLDPWGNPYYLFNPFGLIRGDQGIITQELYGDAFDRYMIVSLGQNGLFGGGDDLFYVFGGGVSGTYLTSLRGDGVTLTSPPASAPPTYSVEAGTSLTLRGVNFGAPAPNKQVLFGDTVLPEVTRWTSREIDVKVPESLSATNGFRIQIGTGSTNALQATITGSHTGVSNWGDY